MHAEVEIGDGQVKGRKRDETARVSSELGSSSRLPNTSNLNSDTTTTKHRQVMSLIDTNKSCLKQSERESQRVRLRLHCPTERAAGLYENCALGSAVNLVLVSCFTIAIFP